MPTYDYECGACEHRFELFQSITAKPVKKCPVCGKLKVRRLIGTGAGVIFKGSGFYCTDYRGKDYKEAAKKDSGGGAGGTGDSSSSGASDSSGTGASSGTKEPAGVASTAASRASNGSAIATKSAKSAAAAGGDGKK